ncbi:putative disease resistance RPP13-like protein 1 [Macadamia integrifolia]|uniref:putative disease resistance RPP13-like protein 1 n=1 Tax=Macadamia integrifolia TaxID=60698 RepID=UPI001C4F901C|nr:putative disease resistance RPP13-like protein 1 [Macadamia integrifolia]
MASGSSRPRVFSQRPPTISLVNTSKVFGREEDMWKIVRWLLSPSPSNNDNNFSVPPMVGIGGVGKMTLAQLVYNDESVEKPFGLKAWVSVSEDFDVVRLTKGIIESATRLSPNSESLGLLQVKLRRSKILVTTRNKSVSSIVCTVPNDYDLKGLSNEACFALVRRHTFIDPSNWEKSMALFKREQKIKVFGQELVKKCKGLPLAMKTLAGPLRHKREDNEWKAILENEIWDLRGSEILPSLMLSYHNLPPLLNRCFADCALFPKDYVFTKFELIILWIAEGIIQLRGEKRQEVIGAGYFDELFMSSFFEL